MTLFTVTQRFIDYWDSIWLYGCLYEVGVIVVVAHVDADGTTWFLTQGKLPYAFALDEDQMKMGLLDERQRI